VASIPPPRVTNPANLTAEGNGGAPQGVWPTRRYGIVSLLRRAGPMVDESYDHSKRWWTLVVLCLSLVIVVVGNTVLNVALPTLVRELHASNSALQWVVDAYGLVFAGLLLTAGAIGDRFGRKGTLTAGLLIFGGASTAAAF